MLDAMAPQKHHQQAGAGGPLLLAATSSPSSSITTVSSSPSSTSTSPSSSSSSGSHQQQPSKHHHHLEQPQSQFESSQTESHDDSNTSTTNATPQDSHNHQATNTAINNTSSGLKNLHNNNSPSLHRSKITGSDQATTKAPSITSTPSSSSLATSTTPAATSTTTTTTTSQLTQNYHHSSNQHNNSSITSSGNVYQSPRYSHHSHQSNSGNHSHPNHASYQTRTNNHQQRGHNNNTNHGNQKNSHQHHQHGSHHHHSHHQHHNHNQTYVGSGNDHHNHKHHHQQLQQQQQHQHQQQHNLPMPFTSSSSSTSLPGSDIASSSSSVTNQRGSSCGPPHYVDLHVNAGECVSLQMLDGQEQFLTGPATITMISQQQNPPVPIPVQVPPGHMVHQIADENGTLRHIILSVMDIDDNTQLNSSVIDLPHGSFRINSHGELVSADTTTTINLGAVASGQTGVGGHANNDDNNSSSRHQDQVAQTAPNQHLPQQQTTTYYANYDGCPVAHNDATQNNNNNSSNNINNNNNNQLSEDNIVAQNQEHQQQEKKLSNDTSNTSSQSTEHEKMDDKLNNQENLPLETQDVAGDKHKQDKQVPDHELSQISEPSVTNNDQTTVATAALAPPVVAAPVYHQQQILGVPELDSGMMPPPAAAPAPHPVPVPGQIIPTVDDQTLYGYPTCSCCCCYCDPTQDPNVAAVAAAHQHHHHQDNPDIMVPHQSEMIMTSELSATPPTISSNVATGGADTGEADLSAANGVLPYAQSTHQHHPNAMLAPIQADPALAMPLNMATGSLISTQALHPLTGQNGLVPMHAPNVHYADVTSSPPIKHHKGSRGGPGGGLNGNYKQTKASQGQTSAGDRHQSNYVGHHNNHHHHHQYNTNQSYNNMVAGSTYYLQDNVLSPSSYKAAGQALLSHPSVMVGSAASATQMPYSNYTNYNQQPATMANVVSSSSSSSTTPSSSAKQGANHTPSSAHHQQSSSNNLAYNRAGDMEHHHHHLQRLNNGRPDNQTGAANRHLAGSNVAYGYRNNQHVDNINKRQPSQSVASIGSDKMPRFGSTNTAASVVAGNSRVLANNHVMVNQSSITPSNNNVHYQQAHHNQHHHHHNHQTNSGNNSNSSSIGGSVSPFRPTNKVKSSYHHNNHVQQQSQSMPPNGARSNVNQPSAYHAGHNAPKIVNPKQDESLTARPNQSPVTKTHLTTKNLTPQIVDQSQHAVPHHHNQQQQRLMTTKHIRSRDRNSASPSSNSSYQNQHLSQSPHRPKQHKQQHQQPSISTSHSANNVGSLPTPPIVTHQHQSGGKHRANVVDLLNSSDRQQQAMGKPVKGQQVASGAGGIDEPTVDTAAAARTSRGKLKKCQKENTKPPTDQTSQTNQQKRQHSNEETRKNSKNRRARSSNEQQTNNLRNSSGTIAEIENHQEKINNVQQKRSSRQEGNKTNQSSKLAKIDASREPTTTTTTSTATTTMKPNQDREESQPPHPSQLKDDASTAINTHPSEDDHSLEGKPTESKVGESSGNSHKQNAEPHGDYTASGPSEEDTLSTVRQQVPSKIKENEPTGTTSVSDSTPNQSPKGESPARKKSKSSPSSSKQSSAKSGPVDTNNSGDLLVYGKNNKSHADETPSSSSNDKNNDDILVVTSLDEGPSSSAADVLTTPPQHKQTIAISLRTSLSENNIQSLNIASLNTAKSTQTTPQKQQQQQQPIKDQTDFNQAEPTAMKKVDTTTTTNIAKRKSSNGKTEQQFKLNSLPQIRLLNLSCVSVTSNSVSLRWTYVASLAEKHGINHHQHHHHHHHGASKHSFCYDHYVVECSSVKNVETNTLVSPKIVYQGCAMACRINSLTPEKIYHFRIRRTVLVPCNDGDNLAVSEILSVTLPSIQQQQTKEVTPSNSGVNHKKAHQMIDSNATTTTSSSLISSSSSSSSSSTQSTIASTARGNTSSQINAQHGNISNNKSSSSHHHHHHHHNNNNHHPVKMSNLLRQCRNRIVSSLGTVMRNSFSNYSDTKFALLLLVVFTIFAMLLAIFIHLYILSPVNE